jgi:aryl-alcohol dehydrogenase-like predicted oxidoreductase
MPEQEAHRILKTAAARGIRFFDTAAAYGESERRIGTAGILADHPVLEVSTKIPATTRDVWSSERAFKEFLDKIIDASCQNFNCTTLGLLQFHQHEIEFIENESVQICMRRLLEEQRCRQIGISVYQPEEAALCCELDHISAIQVPVNLLDRRFFTPGLREKYHSRRMFIIGRSLLLQGVLADDAPLPDVARKSQLQDLRDQLRRALDGRSPLRSALSFAKWALADYLTVALVGADSLKSLEMNIDAWQISPKSEYEEVAGLDLSGVIGLATEHELLNPSTWNRPVNA